MDQPSTTEQMTTPGSGRTPPRPWAALEILLVCGSLLGSGVLGGVAIFGSPTTGARAAGRPSSALTPTAVSSQEAASIVGGLSECLRRAGLDVTATSGGTPPAIGTLSFLSEEGPPVVVIVFATEAAAAQATANIPEAAGAELRQLGRVLIVFTIPPAQQERATLDECAAEIG